MGYNGIIRSLKGYLKWYIWLIVMFYNSNNKYLMYDDSNWYNSIKDRLKSRDLIQKIPFQEIIDQCNVIKSNLI